MPRPFTLRPYQTAAVDAALSSPASSRLIVAPVGSGKTPMIAELVRRRLSAGLVETQRNVSATPPRRRLHAGRVLVLTHTGELVEQNASTVARQCPDVPVGVLAGSLGRRDVSEPVIVGNVASVHRAVPQIIEHGVVSTVIVDEAHRIDPDGKQYAETLNQLRRSVPDLTLFGLTGSPWRDGHGHIAGRGLRDQAPIFEDVACDIPHGDMVQAGFILPVRPRKTQERIDLAGVTVNSFGDYATGDLDERINRDQVNAAAINEVIAFARQSGRQRWLLFAVTIDHAERLANELIAHGVAAGVVSAKTTAKDRADIIAAFRSGALTAVVNVAALTTGFDVPEIDLIALLRPTRSRVLYYQMLGRGSRLADGKTDCVVLDFGGAVLRLGCLEDIDWHGDDGDAQTRDAAWCCPTCDTYNPRNLEACDACGTEKPKRKAPPRAIDPEKSLSATDQAIGAAEPRQVNVRGWSGRLFLVADVPNVLLTFRPRDGGEPVTHAFWFAEKYPGTRQRLAADWQRFGGSLPAPADAAEALKRFEAGELTMPIEVTAKPALRNGRTYWNLREAYFLEAA